MPNPTPVAPQWYFARNKQKIGPMPFAQLQHLAASGELKPGDMVCQDGTPKWTAANAVPGLFAPASTVDQRGTAIPPAATVTQRPPEAGLQSTVSQGVAVQPLAASRPREPALPTHVAGYEILGVLGRGGMGVVYKARHVQLKRLVALKMILAGEHASGQELARFRTEAEAVARLQHPNIVQIYEIGDQDGRPFFSLEFVDGGSLDRKLNGTPLLPDQAARLLETLARAVHHAHTHGIVHRDLKPANVLLVSGGVVSGESSSPGSAPSTQRAPLSAHDTALTTHDSPLATYQPKITDFGLAKQLDSEGGQTHSGAIMGTPSYMAPEQASGDIKAIGPLTDVYALGAIFYELLTGRPPFRGATVMETLGQVLHDEPVPPSRLQPKLPRDLETICLKCLEKEPGKRYASAQELADDLHRFLEGRPIAARPATRLEQFVKFAKRNKALVGGVAGVAFMFVVAIVGTTIGMIRADAQRELAEQKTQDERKAIAQYLAENGRRAGQRGHWRLALENYQQAIAYGYPDSLALRVERVRALVAVNDSALARQEIAELLKRKDLGKHEGPLLLMNGDLNMGTFVDNQKALDLVRQAVAKGLPPADLAYAKGILAETAPEAVKHLQEALKHDPFHHEAQTRLVCVLIFLGRHDEAHILLAKAELLYPEDPGFKVWMAVIYALNDKMDLADKALDGTDKQLKKEDIKLIRACLKLVNLFHHAEEMLTKDPQAFKAQVLVATFQIAAAMPQVKPGESEAAVFASLGGMSLPPFVENSFKRLLPMLLPLQQLSDDPREALPVLNKAIAELNKAIDALPEGSLMFMQGMLLWQAGRHREAEAMFMKSAETPALIPLNKPALMYATVLQGTMGSPKQGAPDLDMRKKCIANVRKLITQGLIRAEDAPTLVGAAQNGGEYDLARFVIADWERQTPDALDAARSRAHNEFKAGAYGPAIDAARKVLDKEPNDASMQALVKQSIDFIREQAKTLTP